MRSLPFTFQWQVSSGGEGAQGLLKEVGEEVAQEFICLYVYLRDDIERKECFLSGIAQIGGGGGSESKFLGPFFKKRIFGQ